MASPTIVQVVPSSSTKGDAMLNNGQMYINLPNPAKVGNSIAVFFERSGSVAGAVANSSCTDDQGNTYVGVQGGNDSGNDQVCSGFYTINLSAPVKQVILKNVSAGSQNFWKCTVVEMNDVTAIDGTNNATATGTAVTGGSITPTQTGDLFLLYGARTSSTPTSSFAPHSQANITWRQVSSDINDGDFLQAGVYNSVSALNAQGDMGTSTSWVSCCMAFKAGTSGSPRTGAVLCGVHHTGFLTPTPNPIKIQVPAIGNLLVIMRSGGVPPGSGVISSITDNKGNSWTVRTAVQNDASIQCAYALAPVVGNDLLLTITPTDNVGDHTYMIYDFFDPNGTPTFDKEQPSTGTQAADADLTTVTLTPAALGIIFGAVSWAHGTAVGLTDSAMVFDAIHWDDEPVDGPTNLDENNGWGHIYNTDLTARTFTWVKTVASPSAQGWESIAEAFKAAPVSAAPTALQETGWYPTEPQTNPSIVSSW